MSIFDEYSDRESLLKKVAAEILETKKEDGSIVFRLQNRDADTLRAKYDAEVRNARSQREKKQEAEAKLAEIMALREKDLVELEQLRGMNPADLRATLQKYVDQTAESNARIKALEKEIAPLKAENEEFRAKAVREKIEAELVKEARRLNCCETAFRDVKRLAPLFHINEAGIVVDNNNKLVPEILQAEIEQSPHWLKRSQSAGANPGGAPLSSEAQFREALKGTDFAAVLANAPRTQVR